MLHPVSRSRGMQPSAIALLAGRTGSGKTAILKYIRQTAEHTVEIDPIEMSMSYVSNSDALNFLHAIGADLDLLFQVLWKHVMCIEFIRLRWSVDNEEKSRTVFSRLWDRFTQDDRRRRALNYLREWGGKVLGYDGSKHQRNY
jgi:Cdc6-like AAA superfamily ATPase